MNELPKVQVSSLFPEVRERVEKAVERMMEAVNQARPGELITGSEEAVRDIGHDLIREVYEAALQKRITAAEAAFSPSAGHGDRTQEAKQGEATHVGADDRGSRRSVANLVSLTGIGE
jgi:hypothetical protein